MPRTYSERTSLPTMSVEMPGRRWINSPGFDAGLPKVSVAATHFGLSESFWAWIARALPSRTPFTENASIRYTPEVSSTSRTAVCPAVTVTGIRAASRPAKLTTSVCVPSGTAMLKPPPRSDTAEIAVPSTEIWAPGSRSPVALLDTVPVMVPVRAP